MKTRILEKLKSIFSSKKFLLFFLLFAVSFLLFPSPLQANWALTVIGGLLGAIISGIGYLLVMAIYGLSSIAQYAYFLDSGAVSYGWVVVRDLCNMFFVVILLIIAFGTMLNLQEYNYKKLLPKLILMAILINFSKTICGILIDISQIVMLTFVASFADISSATLFSVLGITDILQLNKTASKDAGFWTVIGAYLLGLFYVIIALIVIITMIVMLAMRIVMIWIYVVLSPLAYLLNAFPGGKKYHSQWWSEFIKNLIVGPVLAFFLWLSLAGLQADSKRAEDSKINEIAKQEFGKITGDSDDMSGVTKATTPDGIIKFVIAIGMLVGGLKITSSIGGAAGSIAGKGMNSVNKAANIGLKGAAAITGVRYAKGVYSSYKGKKEQRRKEKYNRHAGITLAAEDRAKDKVRDTINYVPNKIVNSWGKKNKEKIKEKEVEIEKKRQERIEIGENIEGKKDFKAKKGGQDFSYQWSDKDSKWNETDSTGRIVNTVDSETLKNDLNDNIDKDIDSSKKELEKEKLSLNLKEWTTKIGLLATGGGLSAALGNLPLLLALPAFTKKPGTNPSASYREERVKEEEGKLKNLDDRKILAKFDDESSNKFTRLAAAIEAMNRGLLSKNDINKAKKIDFLGGYNKDGSFKDKSLDNYFESVISKKYTSLSREIENLKSSDASVREMAELDIKNKIKNGKYSLENVDSETLKTKLGDNNIASEIISGMNLKKFVSEFEKLEQSKKDIVSNSSQERIKDLSNKYNKSSDVFEKYNLIRPEIEDYIKKIAKVESINKAFSNVGVSDSSWERKVKVEIVNSIKASELSDLVNGDNINQVKSIKDIIAGSFSTKKDDLIKELFPKLESFLKNGSQNAMAIDRTFF